MRMCAFARGVSMCQKKEEEEKCQKFPMFSSTRLPLDLDGSAGLRPDPSGCCPLRAHCGAVCLRGELTNPPPHYFRCRLPVQGAAADLENLAQNAKICRMSYFGPKIIFQ